MMARARRPKRARFSHASKAKQLMRLRDDVDSALGGWSVESSCTPAEIGRLIPTRSLAQSLNSQLSSNVLMLPHFLPPRFAPAKIYHAI